MAFSLGGEVNQGSKIIMIEKSGKVKKKKK
jgi:hypothetical protein